MKCDKCNKEITGLCYRFQANRPEKQENIPWKKTERKHLKVKPFLSYFLPEEKNRTLCKECGAAEILKQ